MVFIIEYSRTNCVADHWQWFIIFESISNRYKWINCKGFLRFPLKWQFSYLTENFEFCLTMLIKYQPFWRVWLGPELNIIVSDPNDIEVRTSSRKTPCCCYLTTNSQCFFDMFFCRSFVLWWSNFRLLWVARSILKRQQFIISSGRGWTKGYFFYFIFFLFRKITNRWIYFQSLFSYQVALERRQVTFCLHWRKFNKREYVMAIWIDIRLFLNEKIQFLGKKWHDRRKIITPAFHFNILEKFVEIFERLGNTVVEKLDTYSPDQTVQFYSIAVLYALDVMCGKFFGVEPKKKKNQAKEKDKIK